MCRRPGRSPLKHRGGRLRQCSGIGSGRDFVLQRRSGAVAGSAPRRPLDGHLAKPQVDLRQITLTLTAQQPSLSLSGAVQVSGGFGGNANPPVIAQGGVTSAMNLSAGASLGPGSLISILGVRLAEGNA